jgi:hypothetical protein
VDLLGLQFPVFAAVQFGRVRIDNHILAEARQFAGLSRSLHRAAKSQPGEIFGEHRPHPFGKSLAVVS